MNQDFLRELEFLGVTARIKRLSDSLFYSIKELYAIEGIDIEPSWHLVFLILKEEEKISMIELARKLNISKPALTKMINKMAQKEYVAIQPDETDNRKKLVCLSEKAHNMLPKFERVWDAGQKAVQQMLEDNAHFMSALKEFEKQHFEKSFKDRVVEQLDK
ncbi:MAG: hypothetical protein CMO01_27500 [Thalassobius sp.]|nr:hypothetical protein [Thalassovita sp.]